MNKKKSSPLEKKVPQMENHDNSLQILTGADKVLSKEQQTFNKLTKEIEKLSLEIAREGEKLESILVAYGKIIPPVANELAGQRIVLAKVLDSLIEKVKFSARQKITIGNLITWLLTDAFTTVRPDDATKALYDKWSETSYDEELEQEKAEMKSSFSSSFKEKFGIDLDLSGIDDNPETFHRIREKAEEEFRKKEAAESSKKKSKSQLLKEARLEATEKEKLKSIRSIYHSLAKMLHPDTASNEDEKLLKDELMKKITIAYNEKDISTLLKLELEFVASESNNLQNLAKEKLKLYIMVLQDQYHTLINERMMIGNHPRYMPISDFSHFTEKDALNMVKAEGNGIKNQIKAINSYINGLRRKQIDKKEIMYYVKDLEEEKEIDEDSMFDFGDLIVSDLF